MARVLLRGKNVNQETPNSVVGNPSQRNLSESSQISSRRSPDRRSRSNRRSFPRSGQPSPSRPGQRQNPQPAKKPLQHHRKRNALQRRHQLQQLLRILARQIRPRRPVEKFT